MEKEILLPPQETQTQQLETTDLLESSEVINNDPAALVQVNANETTLALKETVVYINRVTKVVSGGKRLAFAAVVIAGDGHGRVGVGKGKARDVQSAITKASYQAKKHLMFAPLLGTTIPFEMIGNFGSARVLLKPASPGTGVIAGSTIRAILEACGIRDILTKNLGTSNIYNVIYATLDALKKLSTKEAVAQRRGKKVEEI